MAKKRKRAEAAEAPPPVPESSDAEDSESENSEAGGAEDGTEADNPSMIVVGTYEGAILGFRTSGKQCFGYAPHLGCVKSLTCGLSGKLASGGTDHSVRLFDLNKGVELGELQEHEDTVACLDFAGTSSLVTAGDDGQVCIWRGGDWELLLKFKAHKVGVAAVAAHPSGRLMASAGRDRTIRLWDLTRGTSAANLAVEAVAEVLEWAPDGHHLAALSACEVSLVDTRTAAVSSYQDSTGSGTGIVKVTLSAMTFLRDDVIIVGDDRANLRVLRADGKSIKEVCRLPADAQRRGRVKGLVRCSEDAEGLIFAVGMSMGRVEVWRMSPGALPSSAAESAFTRLQVVDTGARLTSLAAWAGPQAAETVVAPKAGGGKKKKRKKGGKK